MVFKSDFSLIPVNKVDNPNWEYRPATWSQDIDPEVHKLFDSTRDQPITYSRRKFRDGKYQTCIVKRLNDKIIMEPGDGFNYLVQKNSEINKTYDSHDVIDNDAIPHELLCVVCLDNKRTYAAVPCGHLITCKPCTDLIKNTSDCLICKQPVSTMTRLYF